MDFNNIALAHRVAVTFYIGYFFVKVFMVLLNRKEQLQAFKKKTLILEILLPLIFIGTGIWMIVEGAPVYETTKSAGNPWFHIKMTLMVIGIVTGIIGIKKFNKVLALISLFSFLGMYGYTEAVSKKVDEGQIVAEPKEENTEVKSDDKENAVHVAENTGIKIYSKYCVTCHGEDGTKGLAGAANLKTSVLTSEEKIEKIKVGGGGMAPYKETLKDEEIHQVADYIETLK